MCRTLRFRVALVSACILGTAMGGCCYPCAMLWHGLTNVSSSTTELSEGELVLKTDAFLMHRGEKLELARPGVRFGVPPSAENYRDWAGLYSEVQAVVPAGTRLRRVRREYHNVGYIFWQVDHAVITSGSHEGTEVRLVGFGPKKTWENGRPLKISPNPDLFDFADLGGTREPGR